MHLLPHTFVLALTLLWTGNSLAQTVDTQAGTTPTTTDTPPTTGTPPDTPGSEAPITRPRTLTIAPIVYHWTSDPEHKYSFVFTLEQHLDRQRLAGLALFRNSFGQPSAYAYAGYHWHEVLGNSRLSVKVSAGIIYGYTDEYEDKVPLNWRGFAPAIIPSLSYQTSTNGSINLMVLGTAGVVLGYSHSFQGLLGP
jgi:hypothetical protein